jgi:hypothetical protein
MSRTLSKLTLAAALAALTCADAWSASEQPSAATHDSPPASEALQEVTVTAQRARLAKRVSKFVDQIAARADENDEGLPLWDTPVCPSVTGVTRQAGEFLLWRISEIARAAGVPVAGEDCRPNLFIFVTAQPKELLEAMAKRKRAVTFGISARPLTVDEFIATPRPVRVWYKWRKETAEHATPNYGLQGDHPCPFADIGNHGGIPAPTICDWERSSRLTSALVWVFSYVYVIVDSNQLRGLTWRQLADYVGMVGLAQIKPTAHLGDAPTILKVFDGASRSAPAAMTDWDQAFLKSLYSTEQRLKEQRRDVAITMVRQLEH